MTRIVWRRLIATSTALTLIGAVPALAEENPTAPQTVSVTNFTDFHGHLLDDESKGEIGAAKLAGLMDAVGQDNDIQLRTTSGDNVGGSAAISAISDDSSTLKALNEMNLTASAAGNHEFDQGLSDLKDRIIPQSNYPILAANVVDKSTGQPVLPASHIVRKGELSVGFIGTMTQKLLTKVSPGAIEGLEVTDPVAAANAEAKRLKEEEGVDVVIVLQHEDIQEFGGFNSYVDAAFGGDSHFRHLIEPNLAQSQEFGKVLSELEFSYDPATDTASNFHITQYDYPKMAELNVQPHPAVAAVVTQAEQEFEEKGGQVLATVDKPFLRGERGQNRGVESTLNNMIAESSKASMDAFLGGGVIEVGLMNAGGVRADLNAGDVTFADALTVLPFGNELAYATMSGAAIIQALENQWQAPGADRARLALGVSDNVTYAFDPSKPKGERILSVSINGEPLDPQRDYKVAASTFLFEGGDSFIDPTQVRDLTLVGYLDVTAFADYVKQGPSLRTTQGEIGVTGLDSLKAGTKVHIDLSALNYSNPEEFFASTVTVDLDGVSATADIDNSLPDDSAQGTVGRAHLLIDVPSHTTGPHHLTVTTDAGTKVTIPVTIAGADQKGLDEQVEPGKPGQTSSGLFTSLSLS